MAPAELSLGLTSVQAPLGLVMLVMLGLVSGLFALFVTVQLATALADNRRHAKSLQSQRDLADKAEASRLAALQNLVADAFAQAEAHRAEQMARTGERIAALEKRLQDKLEESTRELSAYMGEVEDKLDSALRPAAR